MLIVGYGSIGEAVERRLAGWEVTIDRVARRARDGVHAIGELPRLLPNADVVVVLVPVTEETRQLVNAEFLKTMKDGALLVNAARGVIVDTDALLAELTSGRLRAALDVTDPEPLPAGTRCGPRPACCSPRTSAGQAASRWRERSRWRTPSSSARRGRAAAERRRRGRLLKQTATDE